MYLADPTKSRLALRHGETFAAGRSVRGYNEYDARKGAAQGLKDYLEQLSIEWVGGRIIKFQKVVATYGDAYTPGDGKDLPAANIIGTGQDGDYGAANIGGAQELEPVIDGENLLPPGEVMTHALRTYCWSPGTFESTFEIEVWAPGPSDEDRTALSRMLEDELNPVDWMNGFILELPHYHNAHCVYLPLTNRIEFSQLDARRSLFKAHFGVQVRLPQIKIQMSPKLLSQRLQVLANGVE